MATVTASSGAIDVNGIVTQLMQIERQPLTKLQQAQTGLQTKVSAYGKIQGLLATLQDAAKDLRSSGTWKAATATSADPTAVNASASTGAPAGSYSVRVDQLAQRQTLVGDPMPSSTAVVGGGTLTVQLGTVANGAFSADAARPARSITIAAGATLADVRSAINTAGAGVTAVLVNDAAGARLMLRSDDPGAANAFRITVSDADGNDTDAAGLSALTFDGVGAGNLALKQQPRDAKFNVNTIDLTATTNSPSNVLDGVTLDLRQEGPTPVEITVSNDTAAMRKSVDKFVAAYNAVNSAIADLTKYDPASKSAGTLQGDRTTLLVQQKLRDLLGETVDTGTLSRLSDAGIQVQRDGSLQVNAGKFEAAAADPRRLQTLFGNTDPDPTKTGFAVRLDDLLTQVLGTNGSIRGALDSLDKRKNALNRDQDRLNARLTDTEARLRRTYSALDANLSSMSGALSYVSRLTQQG